MVGLQKPQQQVNVSLPVNKEPSQSFSAGKTRVQIAFATVGEKKKKSLQTQLRGTFRDGSNNFVTNWQAVDVNKYHLLAAAAKHNWDHFWNSKSQSCVACKGDLQAIEKVTNEDKLNRRWSQKVTSWVPFHFLPWIFGMYRVCKAQRNRAAPQDLNLKMLSTGSQLFIGECSRIHVQGSSKRTGRPIVSLDLISSVQLFT